MQKYQQQSLANSIATMALTTKKSSKRFEVEGSKVLFKKHARVSFPFFIAVNRETKRGKFRTCRGVEITMTDDTASGVGKGGGRKTSDRESSATEAFGGWGGGRKMKCQE
ncbi:hypothetical protein KM043_010818 [Ampulex compressa]|nr:hypothetical protein KM043_010818 [Ampulex compressa]